MHLPAFGVCYKSSNFKLRIGDDGRQKVVGVLRLLLLRDQGSNVWQQIGEWILLDRTIDCFPNQTCWWTTRQNDGKMWKNGKCSRRRWSMWCAPSDQMLTMPSSTNSSEYSTQTVSASTSRRRLESEGSDWWYLPKSEPRGRILYPCLSLASHSCVANARYTGKKDTAMLDKVHIVHVYKLAKYV